MIDVHNIVEFVFVHFLALDEGDIALLKSYVSLILCVVFCLCTQCSTVAYNRELQFSIVEDVGCLNQMSLGITGTVYFSFVDNSLIKYFVHYVNGNLISSSSK